MNIEDAASKIETLKAEIAKEFTGQKALLDIALITVFSGGHLLIEGVPGLGKTLLVRAIARAIDARCTRVQFTPDLMPSDITGNIMLEANSMKFITKKGPVFTNLFIADEINRASAKTQAALFEAMQEFSVSLDGVSYPLPSPFMTLATENPFEHEGTYPLPEAEKDRFLLKVIVNYPPFEEEIEMVKKQSSKRSAKLSVELINPVMTLEDFVQIQSLLSDIMVSDEIFDYAVRLVSATRNNNALQSGAGPRGSLALLRAARANALFEGRSFVIPDDIKKLLLPALAHRVTLSAESELEGVSTRDVIKSVAETVPAPR